MMEGDCFKLAMEKKTDALRDRSCFTEISADNFRNSDNIPNSRFVSTLKHVCTKDEQAKARHVAETHRD